MRPKLVEAKIHDRPLGPFPGAGLRHGRLLRKAVLAAFILGLAAGAAWGQVPAVTIADDFGDIGPAINQIPGSPWEEEGVLHGADESTPQPLQNCPPAAVEGDIVFREAAVAEPVGGLALTARTIERRRQDGEAAGDLGTRSLVLGDYRPNLVFSAHYRLDVQVLPDSSYHACVRELSVAATFAPVITLAREVTPGGCLEREVLAHERGHWAIDNELLPELRPRLEAAAAAGVGPRFDGETMAELQSRLKAALSLGLQQFVAAFRTARQAGQAAHDAPEELERIDRACGAEASEAATRIRAAPPPESPP